jgi:hypothetical protein
MAMAVINGRRVEIPSTTNDDEIRQAGGIESGRTLLKRDRLGNFVIPRKSKVNVKDGDTFIDAPKRVKG